MSSMKGYTSTTKGNVPKCLRKLRFVIAKKKKKKIKSMYTANSHLRRQGEITLRTQKTKTYCHHKEPRWLYVYMTFYIFFFLYFKKIDKYTGKPDLRSLNILAAVLSYRLRSSSVSLAIRST